MILPAFKHLLPSGRAWRITTEKNLRRFFEGLSAAASDARTFIDETYGDLRPGTTRALSEWEGQFALPGAGLTEDERRDRLAGCWKALGGQDPRYIEDTLQAAGFDVYVHEWWEPGTEPEIGVHGSATPRSPLAVLRREYTGVTPYVGECGELVAECGEPAVQCGDTSAAAGYPLVNKILQTVPDFAVACGVAGAECGETGAECGEFGGFVNDYRGYVVPVDPTTWPYFLYIGGPAFGDMAQVPASRRDEFERLCLKIRPAHLWLGILVAY